MWYKDRHTLLLKWSIASLMCRRKMDVAIDSIYPPLVVHIVSILQGSTLKLHTKCKVWGTLSAWERGCCAAQRDIHCCWIVSWPSLDTWRCSDILLISSTSSIWFKPCYFCQGELSKCIQNTWFLLTSQHRKWDNTPQVKVSSAAEIFHVHL